MTCVTIYLCKDIYLHEKLPIIRGFFVPYFPVFALNTEIYYSVFNLNTVKKTRKMQSS